MEEKVISILKTNTEMKNMEIDEKVIDNSLAPEISEVALSIFDRQSPDKVY